MRNTRSSLKRLRNRTSVPVDIGYLAASNLSTQSKIIYVDVKVGLGALRALPGSGWLLGAGGGRGFANPDTQVVGSQWLEMYGRPGVGSNDAEVLCC